LTKHADLKVEDGHRRVVRLDRPAKRRRDAQSSGGLGKCVTKRSSSRGRRACWAPGSIHAYPVC
jgi:hypothetical protein